MDTLFLERMLLLLSQGSFTTTYKHALLLALPGVPVWRGGGDVGRLTEDEQREILTALGRAEE